VDASQNVTLAGTLTATGVTTVPAGTVSAPAITTTGDTNTGIYFPAADTIAFTEGGTEAMRINSSGNLQTIGTISVGNATPSTSGAGITFPSTDLHYSTNANTLDDYEEGTFTPTIVYSGTNTPTYVYQLGRYTKVGRIVQLQMLFSWNENGSTGNVTVGNLPFTSVTSLARSVPSIVSFGLTGLPVNLSVTGIVNSNATTVLLVLNDNAGTTLSATYTDADQDMYVTVTYEAA
jgi:hypothetical protein